MWYYRNWDFNLFIFSIFCYRKLCFFLKYEFEYVIYNNSWFYELRRFCKVLVFKVNIVFSLFR